MLEKLPPAMTYGGGGSAFLFGFDSNFIGMVAGVVIGLIGVALTWYYKRKQDKREQALFEWQMGRKGE